jgi:hypothetical protein
MPTNRDFTTKELQDMEKEEFDELLKRLRDEQPEMVQSINDKWARDDCQCPQCQRPLGRE